MKAVRALPVLLTVLVVAVGACIPLFASAALDRQLEHETKRWEDTSVSLVLSQEGDFFQTLELFRSDHSQVELSEGEAMNAEKAQEAARYAAALLALGIPMEEEPSVVPMLFASSGAPVSSGIFWCCTWGEKDKQAQLWIDDQSGRMVALESPISPSEVYASDSPFHEAAFNVLEYCQTQYPIDSLDYEISQDAAGDETVASTEDAVSVSKTGRFAQYLVTLSRTVDGRTESCPVPMMIDGERLFFNL